MLGHIVEIIDNSVTIDLDIDINEQPNLVNLHAIFDDGSGRKVVAEIANVSQTKMIANIVGEISDGRFSPGSSSKPSFKSTVRLVEMDELELFMGNQDTDFGETNFGTSNVYEGYKINVPINDFFSNHFAILGNSGAGKSCTVASILQKLFTSSPTPPVNSNLFFFDAYGEYTQAFSQLHNVNSLLNYKNYTTNTQNPDTEILRIPIWLLDVDDLALLLDANSPSQLPILEKTLKLVRILTGEGDSVIRRKNDIIARALQDIMLSGADSTKIRDQVIGVLTKFNTPSLNLNSQIVQPGYTRTLKQCLFVDKTGKMQEMELVVEFIRGYIIEDQIEINPDEMNPYYNLSDLELAMEFALISEGILKSDKVFDTANIMSVRLHTLATGENRVYFDFDHYVTKDEYIDYLVAAPNGGKCQIINFNINYIDDRLAKVFTKVISRMLFLKSSVTLPRGSLAYHIIIEEAHRYVLQHDTDIDLLGYNIFERITKEGRKYGMFLTLITQRPSELSDTCVSQCANFVILRISHPKDLRYIKEMIPNISSEVVLQLKNLKPGNCIAFGSAFKVPISMYIDFPNPTPLSNNVDLEKVWYTKTSVTADMEQQLSTPASIPVGDDVATVMQQAAQTSTIATEASAPQPVQQPVAPGQVMAAPQAVQQPVAQPQVATMSQQQVAAVPQQPVNAVSQG